MTPEQVRVGWPVKVACGPSMFGPTHRTGVVIAERSDWFGGQRAWRVEFPSGATSLLRAEEMEHPSVIDLLALLSECRVEQGESGGGQEHG